MMESLTNRQRPAQPSPRGSSWRAEPSPVPAGPDVSGPSSRFWKATGFRIVMGLKERQPAT